jgi:hypothetical protein
MDAEKAAFFVRCPICHQGLDSRQAIEMGRHMQPHHASLSSTACGGTIVYEPEPW